MTNKDSFRDYLAAQYADLFKNDPEYAYAAARTTPAALAEKMTDGLETGGANRSGTGIKATCKHFGIPVTYKAIQAFFRAAAETPTTTMRGTCHDCSQGAGFKDKGFELYMDGDKPSHWFCNYCGSNHVTIIDEAGNALYDGGDLY